MCATSAAAPSSVGWVSETATQRMFCALDLPGRTADAIAAWQAHAVGDGTRWRAVRRESLHVTLVFLGQRPAADVERIGEILAGLDLTRPVEGVIEPDPVPIPRRGPRLIALGVSGEAIPALQAPLDIALVAAGVHEHEGRPYWPHISVLRRRGRGGAPRPRRAVPPFGGTGPGGGGHAFGAVRIALYRSEIRPDGSQYTCLAARDLPQAGTAKKR